VVFVSPLKAHQPRLLLTGYVRGRSDSLVPQVLEEVPCGSSLTSVKSPPSPVCVQEGVYRGLVEICNGPSCPSQPLTDLRYKPQLYLARQSSISRLCQHRRVRIEMRTE
jgi:hypothetical protein